MKQTTILAYTLFLALAGCAAPIPPRFSDPPNEATPAASANQPSNVETTSSEYDGRSGSTGASGR